MSVFNLDASYTLTCCFPDRATADTYETLRRLELRIDSAVVPWLWQLEVGNAIGKAVVRKKIDLTRALEIWDERPLLPIRQVAIGNIPQLLQLAVKHNLSIYGTCYPQAAMETGLSLATNDDKLQRAAESYGIVTLVP